MVTLPDELAAVLADEDGPGLPAGPSPVLRAPNAVGNGLVSACRPAWERAGTSMAFRRTAAPPGD
jgi:hypothetical protein